MPPVLLPESEDVAIAWIQSIQGFTADVVAAQLPADESQWAANGAVAIAVVGGSPDPDVPIAKPVIQADCWAVKTGSDKPPWARAKSLAAQIRAGVYDKPAWGRRLAITTGDVVYPAARVIGARITTEPRRIYGDAGDYARYSLDLRLSWVSYIPTPSI